MSLFYEVADSVDLFLLNSFSVSCNSQAIDRAGFAVIATGLKQCMTVREGPADTSELERLFLSLA